MSTARKWRVLSEDDGSITVKFAFEFVDNGPTEAQAVRDLAEQLRLLADVLDDDAKELNQR